MKMLNIWFYYSLLNLKVYMQNKEKKKLIKNLEG